MVSRHRSTMNELLKPEQSPAAQALVNLGVTVQRLQPLAASWLPLDEVIDQLADATITAVGSQQHERAAWLRDMEAKLRVVRRRLAA